MYACTLNLYLKNAWSPGSLIFNIENVGMAWGQGYFKVCPTVFDIHIVILSS